MQEYYCRTAAERARDVDDGRSTKCSGAQGAGAAVRLDDQKFTLVREDDILDIIA